MKILKLALKHETAMPVLALLIASGACVALVMARIASTGNLRYSFLTWNLFLAWLPLIFALLACERYQGAARWNLAFVSLAGAWLLFFPNAPYIFTDLIHLNSRHLGHFWVDLVLILLCAVTGLVLGFLSLYLMQSVVERMFGRAVSWLFICGVAALSGFGIYLGRFMRFNSWDVLFKPRQVYHGIGSWVADPLANSTSFVFPILFGAFLFLSYLMLFALTHLRPAQAMALPRRNEQAAAI
ncbi:MAG TPA: DUF1361 domain-containing protein [Candidatus Paceibacterota bacterium]|nr:DUF1361 domain-containing protein [Verrucomicrobiota bacterium]HSA11722.1 DUF1361 domain-containing protein [Candidatus Paceibacterota bacterium]